MDCGKLLRVLGDDTRLRVVEALLHGARSVRDLQEELALEQSLLSYHLAALRQAGIVDHEAAGRYRLYRLTPAVSGSPRAVDLGCCTLRFERGYLARERRGE